MAEKQPEIRSRYNPGEDELADLKYVYERKQQMSDARQDHEERWEDADKMYNMYREEKTDWQSNHVVPTTTAIVESQLSEIVDQNMRPRFLPRGSEDKPRAKIMNSVSDYAWEKGRTDVEIYKAIKDALVRGTGILQDYYRKESRMTQWLTDVNDDGKEEYEERELTEYDDLFAEVVKLEDFFIDEKARGFTGPYPARDCIRRYILDIDTFERKFKGPVWNPLGNAKYVKPGGDTNYYEFYNPPEAIEKDDEVEILWYWSKTTTPGRPELHDHLIIVANDVVIRRGPNPYWHKELPFVRVVDILNSHQFYGTGEADLLKSVQEEQQLFRRQVLDRNHLDIDKGFLVSNREAGLDEEDLISRPHMLVPVDDPDSVKPIEYGDIPRSVQLSMEKLEEDAVRVTGYDDRMQSVQQTGSTATEAAILKEATLKRLRTKIWLLRNVSVYQMGHIRESNIRQFYTQPRVEKIVGEKDSQEYKREIRNAFKSGRLKMIDNEPHREVYRTIRLNDSEIVPDDKRGGVKTIKSKEPTFFEATPELIIPEYDKYDIKLEPTPTIPVSEPLRKEQSAIMFDRLIQVALSTGMYDPVKLGDILLEMHDFDPDEMKPDQAVGQQLEESLVAKSLEVADAENQEMIQGNKLPPTPMAQEPHTEVHVAFLESPEVEELPPESPILANIVRHITGEIQAQSQRKQSMAQQQQPQKSNYSPPSGPSAVKLDNAIPARGEAQKNANALGEAMQGGTRG